jgi:hypothetical protein
MSITKKNCLILFTEIVAVYSENHMKLIRTFCEPNAGPVNVKGEKVHIVIMVI